MRTRVAELEMSRSKFKSERGLVLSAHLLVVHIHQKSQWHPSIGRGRRCAEQQPAILVFYLAVLKRLSTFALFAFCLSVSSEYELMTQRGPIAADMSLLLSSSPLPSPSP